MGLLAGTTGINKAFVGNTPVSKMFVGETQVYPPTSGNLPPGFSFYQEFTTVDANWTISPKQGEVYIQGTYFYINKADVPDPTGLDGDALIRNLDYTTYVRRYSTRTGITDFGAFWKFFYSAGYGSYRNNGRDIVRVEIEA
jgi:hypothetical protein